MYDGQTFEGVSEGVIEVAEDFFVLVAVDINSDSSQNPFLLHNWEHTSLCAYLVILAIGR